MHKLIPEFEQTKITLWDNQKIVFENYQKLSDISNEIIKIDKYIVKGKNLKIEELNRFIIKIYGEIKELIVE